MAAPPFATGKNSILKLFFGPNEMDPLEVESWECGPEGEEIADGVCGEDRDRLDYELNYYSLTLKCFNTSAAKLQKLIDKQAELDAGGQPQDVVFGLILKPKDGSKAAFKGQEGTIGNWRYSADGRTARQMVNIPIRVRYFDKASV